LARVRLQVDGAKGTAISTKSASIAVFWIKDIAIRYGVLKRPKDGFAVSSFPSRLDIHRTDPRTFPTSCAAFGEHINGILQYRDMKVPWLTIYLVYFSIFD